MNLSESTLAKQRAFNLASLQLVVTLEHQLAYLHLVFLVDVYVKCYLSRGVLMLYDVDLGILVTLVVEVFLSQDLGTVDDVTSQTHTLNHTQLSLHILALGLFDTVVVDGLDTWTHT